MTYQSPQAALDDADRLANAARRSGRWYANYLVAYAIGTLILALLVGAFPGSFGAVVGIGIWLVLVAALTIYQYRQRATIKRFGALHSIVIAVWGVLWIITVVVGSLYFVGQLGWWIGAGIATALPPLVGAVVVYRQTR
ncbi:MAG: hypothetical protein L0H41_10195 [Microlunatus sp.]|nr:hypothetical protein [Microlunatus sp.]